MIWKDTLLLSSSHNGDLRFHLSFTFIDGQQGNAMTEYDEQNAEDSNNSGSKAAKRNQNSIIHSAYFHINNS